MALSKALTDFLSAPRISKDAIAKRPTKPVEIPKVVISIVVQESSICRMELHSVPETLQSANASRQLAPAGSHRAATRSLAMASFLDWMHHQSALASSTVANVLLPERHVERVRAAILMAAPAPLTQTVRHSVRVTSRGASVLQQQ